MSRLDLRAMFRNYISQQSLNLESREHFVSFKVRWALVKKKMLSSMKNTCSAHEYHENRRQQDALAFFGFQDALPSHHWASQGFHFTGLNPISTVGLSGCPGEGRYPQNINWSLGSSGNSSLTLPLLHIHYITGYHHTITWFLLTLLY